MSIGERLKKLRGQLSQEEFGNLVGASKAAVGAYERNAQIPGSAFIISTCDRFSIEHKWLLTGQGPMYAANVGIPEEGRGQERVCPRCARLEAKLDEAEKERRELNAENRILWKEVSELRTENAILKERQLKLGTLKPSAKGSISSVA